MERGEHTRIQRILGEIQSTLIRIIMKTEANVITYIRLKDLVNTVLPHEDVDMGDVNSIIKRFKKNPEMRPITIYKNIVMDGHHRFAALVHLQDDRRFKEAVVPVCQLEEVNIEGATWEEVVNASESGELLGIKQTYTTPRSPVDKLAMMRVKKK